MADIDILVVDDERIVALDIRNTLTRLGYNVCAIASSGEEAVDLAGRLSPHLALMDIRLKGNMDGVEAAMVIRSRYRIPVIFLTAYSDDLTLQRAKASEAFGYLIKPFDERELHSSIEVALYKHSLETNLMEAMRSAEKASISKSMFLASMSHEIRTPMNGIIGMAELALEMATDPEQTDCLQTIKHSADTLLELINDILDLSKIEANKLTLKQREFDLRALLGKVMRTHGPQARSRQLDLSLHVHPETPATLVGDALRLTQICNNLLSNAIKFTESGAVELEVNIIRAPGQEATAHTPAAAPGGSVQLLFSVRDTGIGIPDELQERIFETYLQVAQPGEGAGGTGLGLAICKELVQMMGGAIWVRSRKDAGSTFYFTARFELPAVRPRDAALHEEPLPELPRLHVLVADDNEVSRRLARRLLERKGHTAVCVDNGEAALAELDAARFDLVLMNIQMPRLNGMEATRRLRLGHCAQTPAQTPVIAVTAHALRNDRERFLAAGMDEYIAKPLHSSLFYQAIARAITREKPLQSSLHQPPSRLDAPDTSSQAPAPLLDEQGALARIAGDRDLLEEMWQVFLEDGEQKLLALEQARERLDTALSAAVAHSIKGAAASIGAEALQAAAAAMEKDILQGELTRDAILLTRLLSLETTLRQTLSALEELRS